MLFDSGEPTRHFYHEEIIELLLRSEIVQGLDCIHLNMICCIWLHIPLRLYLELFFHLFTLLIWKCGQIASRLHRVWLQMGARPSAISVWTLESTVIAEKCIFFPPGWLSDLFGIDLIISHANTVITVSIAFEIQWFEPKRTEGRDAHQMKHLLIFPRSTSLL